MIATVDIIWTIVIIGFFGTLDNTDTIWIVLRARTWTLCSRRCGFWRLLSVLLYIRIDWDISINGSQSSSVGVYISIDNSNNFNGSSHINNFNEFSQVREITETTFSLWLEEITFKNFNNWEFLQVVHLSSKRFFADGTNFDNGHLRWKFGIPSTIIYRGLTIPPKRSEFAEEKPYIRWFS